MALVRVFQVLLLGVWFAVQWTLTTAAGPIVDLGYAQYQGSVNATTNVATFLGIRYATPPLGNLRFGAPQPPQNMSGVQQATAFPNGCWQAPPGLSSTNPLRSRALDIGMSEDCLFLNVYYPSDTAGVPIGSLPVIVWIHGGGYISGSASIFRGTDIIAQSNRGVVVVAIQYRLGLFGFLPGAEVKNNGALNAGLLDQDFALRWIVKFGGDPSKVTIWGESAGAGSVLQHIVANDGNTQPPLFRAAITSSTFLPSQYNYNDRIPEARPLLLLYSEVVSRTGCSSAADSLTCLREIDPVIIELVNVAINVAAFYGTWTMVPVVDGEFITQRPTLALAQGKVNGEVLLSVTNSFEGTSFVDQSTAATANATQYALELFPNFEDSQAANVGALYANVGPPLLQNDAIMGESIFICPTYYLLDAFAGRSYKGEFAIPPALHGQDQAYYFPSLLVDQPNVVGTLYNNTAFNDAFAQSFTAFAISLDPNIKVDPTTITPAWNKWEAGHTEMLFNKTDQDVPVVNPIMTDATLLNRCR
ncbi:carboxylic ester hydrolase [Favolaschia claudopus]|uniref:Carboxylic ester hydrolase n=1 Tax=Favolaschia claudopus TaxID=2862362 RepID=A0AAW0BYV0_9AGAR